MKKKEKKMIQVNDKYQIREEIIDYSIWEKNSKGRYCSKGYYKNLSEAVRAILNREAHNSSINVSIDLETAVTRLEKVADRYDQLAKEIGEKLK